MTLSHSRSAVKCSSLSSAASSAPDSMWLSTSLSKAAHRITLMLSHSWYHTRHMNQCHHPHSPYPSLMLGRAAARGFSSRAQLVRNSRRGLLALYCVLGGSTGRFNPCLQVLAFFCFFCFFCFFWIMPFSTPKTRFFEKSADASVD